MGTVGELRGLAEGGGTGKMIVAEPDAGAHRAVAAIHEYNLRFKASGRLAWSLHWPETKLPCTLLSERSHFVVCYIVQFQPGARSRKLYKR